MKRPLLIGFLAVLAVHAWGQENPLLAAITAMQKADYSTAANALAKVTADPAQAQYHGQAYLLLAKAQLALNAFPQASATLEHYLREFPKHPGREEGVYLRGRILYLEGDLENALIAFQQFLKSYPDSTYAANAMYWSGEALFALGRLDEALVPLRAVYERWPDSAKAEAARYRAREIELAKRESQLLTLLKLSHQETLRALEEAGVRQRTYEQAIAAYQRRLAGEGSACEQEVARLQALLEERDRQIEALKTQAGSSATAQASGAAVEGLALQKTARLLKAKAEALQLEAALLRRLAERAGR